MRIRFPVVCVESCIFISFNGDSIEGDCIAEFIKTKHGNRCSLKYIKMRGSCLWRIAILGKEFLELGECVSFHFQEI